MVKRPAISCDGIFVGTEFRQVLINKELESLESTGAGGLPVSRRLYAKFLGYLFIYFVWRCFWVLIPAVVLGWWKSVVFVKIPGIAFWLSVFHQNPQTQSLLAIEIFHNECLLCFRPGSKKSSGCKKEVILYKLSAEFLELSILNKA